MAGRRPTPTALKVLRGNPGKRALAKSEPKPRLVAPPPPKRIRKAAGEMWRRLVPVLARLRVLTEGDVAALELTCNAWADYHEAQAAIDAAGGAWYTTINEAGGELVRAHPALTERSDAWRRFRAGLVEFGLTPAARTKVAAAPEDPDAALEEFLGPREVVK